MATAKRKSKVAITRQFGGATLYVPGGSGSNLHWTHGPEWIKHEIFARHADSGTVECYRTALACLRALRNVRIISGVRSNSVGEIWIDARLPQDG